MREGMLCIILPEQIVQQGGRSDDFSGSFIAVSRDFMDLVIPTMQQLFPMFFMIKERPCIAVTADELQAFEEYHSFLWSKVKLKDNPYRKEITQGLLMALFYEIYDIYQGHAVKERTPKSRKEDLFERFIRYVYEFYKEERSVSFYADKMFLTPKHLSTVVKEVSGKTAGEWIDSLVILEAKAMLKSSEQSIQEIADELHFANQSFFGKYFKHHTAFRPRNTGNSNIWQPPGSGKQIKNRTATVGIFSCAPSAARYLVYPKKTNLSLSKTNLLYRFLNDVANLKSYFKVLFDIYQKRIIS